MFHNAYQSGNYVDIFDAKVNREKDRTYDKLLKITHPQGVHRVYDKQLKSYIYELEGSAKTKLSFPKDEKQELGLIQPYLVVQMLLPHGTPFFMEITITDTNKNKRRIHLTSAVKAIAVNYFHIKVPVDSIKRGTWLNLSIDLLAFFELFKNQTFRSLDGFSIGSYCKLRRVFTMKSPLQNYDLEDEFAEQPTDAQMVPKTQSFAPGVSYINQLINLDSVQRFIEENDGIIEGGNPNYNNEEREQINNGTGLSDLIQVKGLSTGQQPSRQGGSRMGTSNQNDRYGLKSQQLKLGTTNYESEKKKAEESLVKSPGMNAPVRNNLMSEKQSRNSRSNQQISKAQKILFNNHGNFQDEDKARTPVPRNHSKDRSHSPQVSLDRKKSLSKKQSRGFSTDNEEEKSNLMGAPYQKKKKSLATITQSNNNTITASTNSDASRSTNDRTASKSNATTTSGKKSKKQLPNQKVQSVNPFAEDKASPSYLVIGSSANKQNGHTHSKLEKRNGAHGAYSKAHSSSSNSNPWNSSTETSLQAKKKALLGSPNPYLLSPGSGTLAEDDSVGSLSVSTKKLNPERKLQGGNYVYNASNSQSNSTSKLQAAKNRYMVSPEKKPPKAGSSAKKQQGSKVSNSMQPTTNAVQSSLKQNHASKANKQISQSQDAYQEFGESLDRFNTVVSRGNELNSSNRFNSSLDQRTYDEAKLGEWENDDIESIEENLEYELTSNGSVLNGSQGMNNYSNSKNQVVSITNNQQEKINANRSKTAANNPQFTLSNNLMNQVIGGGGGSITPTGGMTGYGMGNNKFNMTDTELNSAIQNPIKRTISTNKKSLNEFKDLFGKGKDDEYSSEGIINDSGDSLEDGRNALRDRMMEDTIEDFQDSLDDKQLKLKKKQSVIEERNKEKSEIGKGITNLEDQMMNMVSKVRPYSPPFSAATLQQGVRDRKNVPGNQQTIDRDMDVNPLSEVDRELEDSKYRGSDARPVSSSTTQSTRRVILEKENTEGEEDNNNVLEVVYDPVWNCYYHPQTNTYYEIKE